MEETKFKNGDIIYFKNGKVEFVNNNTDNIREYINKAKSDVQAVVRPVVYKTIYKEEQKEILTSKEKEYLENVLKPFKESVKYIVKYDEYANTIGYMEYTNREFILIVLNDTKIQLPYFKKDTMYKGMKLNHNYTLEDLGLFRG